MAAVFSSIFDKFLAFFNSILTIFNKDSVDRNEEAEGVINGWWDIITKAE